MAKRKALPGSAAYIEQTGARAATMLRSAASALEHGRWSTFRNKVQKVCAEFGISPVFLPQGETANERAKRITNHEPSLEKAFGLKVWYGITYLLGSERRVLYDLGYTSRDSAESEKEGFFTEREQAHVVKVTREILGWPRESVSGPYIDWIESTQSERQVCECGRWEDECAVSEGGSEHHNL